jgi:heme-degrading monooxygenase HmoA
MISRHWKGIARPGYAEAYVQHLRHDTFPDLARIPGFVRASILRRNVETGTEFQIVTVWESLTAIKAFAGEDPEIAVVPASVREMLSTYDQRVVHYEIAESFAPRGEK